MTETAPTTCSERSEEAEGAARLSRAKGITTKRTRSRAANREASSPAETLRPRVGTTGSSLVSHTHFASARR